MKIVSVLNHKGGVGKTTFAGCTAQALALCGYRVLTIDNDSQHNLSAMLGVGVREPNIRSVYLASAQTAAQEFLRSVRKTSIPDLHIVTGDPNLANADVPHARFLRSVLDACGLDRFYDFVLIDNAPGMDRLQECAIAAADEIFVPTELRQFAVDGLVELKRTMEEWFPRGPHITRIVPNFYRGVKREQTFLHVLERLFPGRVTETPIPLDNVFDEIVTDNKVLFIHRLKSKGTAYFLKLIHELFDLAEDDVWEQMMEKRAFRLREEARERYFRQQALRK